MSQFVEKTDKRCINCSTSQQIKCFGIEVVRRGIKRKKKCVKQRMN